MKKLIEIYQNNPIFINIGMLLAGALIGYLVFHQVDTSFNPPELPPAPVGESAEPEVKVLTK